MPRSVPPTRDTDTNTAPVAGLTNVCGVKMNGCSHWYGIGDRLVVHVVTVGKKQNLKQSKSNYIEQVALLC